jgi:translation initiation factor IF-2
LEEFGGEVQCALISAKTGEGLDDLVERLFLQVRYREIFHVLLYDLLCLKSDIIDLSFDRTTSFEGEVAEVGLDKRIGVVVTGMAKKGTLKIGDTIIAGSAWGNARLLLNQNKEKINETEPGIPFQVCVYLLSLYQTICYLVCFIDSWVSLFPRCWR